MPYQSSSRRGILVSRKTLLAVALLVSALLAIYIIAEDAVLGPSGGRFLWATANVFAPVPHLWGLFIMLAIDLILAGLVLARGGAFATAGAVWGVLQFLAMVLDPLTAFYYNFSTGELATYLFGIWAFDARVIVQLVIIVLGLRARKTG